MTVLAFTLKGQVRHYATRVLGWPREAAEDAAAIAVEVAGSNASIFGLGLGQVVSEACHVDGEDRGAQHAHAR